MTDAPRPVVSQDWLAHHAAVRPDKVAVTDLGTDRRFTYRELNDRVARLAAALHREYGVGRGDRVAVLGHNSVNLFEAQFACWKLGAIFVPLNWRLARPELQQIVDDCRAAALLYSDAFATNVAALESVAHRLAWGGLADEYEEVIARTPPDHPTGGNTLETILTVMYTSGTTGRPKGVIITHGMTVWNVVNQTELFRTSSSMVNLVVLPMFHTGGLNTFANPAFHYGGSNVVMRTWDAELALRVLASEELGITHMQSVPANYLFMSQAAGFAAARFPTLVAAGVGGASPSHTLIETWLAKGVRLQQAFGMTETGSMVMALPIEDAVRKIGSAGLPFLHNECRVVDQDGRDVARGEIGELWMRGPNITPGYWELADATAAAFVDGWFRSGDAVRQDDDGYYYVVDRWKDMYISGGENVYPAEVENVISQIAGVADVAVIGVPDDRWQEVGRAYIVRAPGADIEDRHVIEHCSVMLARYKVPKSVAFVDALPRNATGKVLKATLRSWRDG